MKGINYSFTQCVNAEDTLSRKRGNNILAQTCRLKYGLVGERAKGYLPVGNRNMAIYGN